MVADYCLTCSDDSSEGDYDPTQECFVAMLGEHNDNDNDNDDDVAADAARSDCSAWTNHPGKRGRTAGSAGATPGA